MFLITCFKFFSSSHDLLEIIRLVLDQFNLFFFGIVTIYRCRIKWLRREETTSRTTPSIHRKELFEKGEHSFPYINSVKLSRKHV